MCSGYESGWPSKVMWCATTTAGSGQGCSSVIRRSSVCGGSLRDLARHRLRRLRHAAEILLHELLGLRRLEVADQRQRGVLRDVERRVEIADVLDRRGLQVGHAADRRMLVRVHLEGIVVDDLVQLPVRLVVDPHPALFLHHLAFVGEGRFTDAQRGHAIRFEPQRQREILRRHRLPEHRFVVGRVGVGLAADRGNERGVRFGLDVLRALEHHVLEEMREPRASRPLVLRTDVVPERHMNDRRRVILREDHGQAVVEFRDVVLELGRPDGRGRTAGRRQNDRGHGGQRGDCAGHEVILAYALPRVLHPRQAKPRDRPRPGGPVERIGVDHPFETAEHVERAQPGPLKRTPASKRPPHCWPRPPISSSTPNVSPNPRP